MGFLFSKILNKLSSKQNFRILMLGLDNAGKSTILFNMKLGEVVKTMPTIGKVLKQDLIMRQWNTKMLNFKFGMLEDKIVFVLCGNIIIKTQRLSYL